MKYIAAGSFRWRPEVWEGGRRQEVFLHVVLQAEEEHSEGVKKEEPVFFGGVRPGQEPPEGFSGGSEQRASMSLLADISLSRTACSWLWVGE